MREVVLRLGWLALLTACAVEQTSVRLDGKWDPGTASGETPDAGTGPGGWNLEEVIVDDLGGLAGVQGTVLGHQNRGRATITVDFDRDGLPDLYLGNPGDPSQVFRNITTPGGTPAYELVQVLTEDHLSWSAGAADYDNDGDIDLFVGGGGNECDAFDLLFENQWAQTGELWFEEVGVRAGVSGRRVADEAEPIPSPTAGVTWVDADNDGDVDLFLAGQRQTACGMFSDFHGRNTLYLNNGAGTFEDVTESVGLHGTKMSTRHPTWLDVDNDGDMDLYESNLGGFNWLWRNEFVETGKLTFVLYDTMHLGGDDIRLPERTFASCAADFDNDGWEDLIAFRRSDEDCSLEFPGAGTSLDTGHALFLNREGVGFMDVANPSGLNVAPIGEERARGVMGCQVGDLDGDGGLDVFMGNGGPTSGETNHLFLSDLRAEQGLRFVNARALIDFPAPDAGVTGSAPPYPYRTHGTVFVDINRDGTLEMLVNNGGPAFMADRVREPNRLFDFRWPMENQRVFVTLQGDGVNVARDAIGARLALTVERGDGSTHVVHRTVRGAVCFSAQPSFEQDFGLGTDGQPVKLEVRWTDGTVTVVDDLKRGGRRTVVYAR
jgi:hypothetical protein